MLLNISQRLLARYQGSEPDTGSFFVMKEDLQVLENVVKICYHQIKTFS